MSHKRAVIVGDVHGCAEELHALLNKLSFDPDEDHLIFVGDLIHKGPRSADVLQFVEDLEPTVVLGNHERFFVQTVEGKRNETQNLRELKERLGSQGVTRWCAWMRSLPTYYEEDEFLVVHAGLEPERHPSQSSASLLTTIRTWDGQGENLNRPDEDKAWYDFYDGKKLVIYGHWARQGLTIRRNTLGLDSGCLYGGWLSAVVMPERRIVQVRARRQYVVPGEPYQ